MKVLILLLGWITTALAYSVGSLDAYSTNFAYVNDVNALSLPWELEMNRFGHLSTQDFDNNWKGYRPTVSTPVYQQHRSNPKSFLDKVDWRSTPLVGKIKDQKQCGSCWAFSAVASLEGQVAKLVNKSVSLSEQDMVDCVKDIPSPDGTSVCCDGCGGGEMYSVYQYLTKAQHGKDDTEDQYKYTATNGICSPVKSKSPGSGVKGFVTIQKGDEKAMMDALARVGPLSVGVDANTDWQLYKQGVYAPNSTQCSSDPMDQDHGVAVVGYGSSMLCNVSNCTNLDYWIIRNSWGESWGEKGYMRLLRGTNACGVANSAIYPVLQ